MIYDLFCIDGDSQLARIFHKHFRTLCEKRGIRDSRKKLRDNVQQCSKENNKQTVIGESGKVRNSTARLKVAAILPTSWGDATRRRGSSARVANITYFQKYSFDISM